jgi:tetratricopeptide (TPR) repeat protein
VDGIEEIDQAGIHQGDFTDSRLGFCVAYGRTLSRFDVGAAVSLEHHSLGDYSSTSSPGLDLSVARRLVPASTWLKQVTLALHLRNVVRPSIKLVDDAVDYPAAAEGGASFEIAGPTTPHSLTISAAASKASGVDPAASFGAEYRYRDLVALRGGLRSGKAAFGVGLAYNALSFDYALVDRDFGSLHLFTLTTSFGTPLSVRRHRRAERREAEFNRLMSDRLTERNRALSEQLVADGTALLEQGELERALDHFDRALFLARSAGADTSKASAVWNETRQRIVRAESESRYRSALDSARARQDQADYVASRYFAGLALAERPTSAEASNLVTRADRALAQTALREEMIKGQLLAVDSLLSYGRISAALQTAEGLEQIAGDDPSVRAAVRRTRFENWRTLAADAYADQAYPQALAALDSALSLFPGHKVCLDLQSSVRRALSDRPAVSQPAVVASKPISSDLESQVKDLYESGRRAFEEGLLTEAISRWEKVELLAPGYQAVRAYLVNAYKFVGVEHYGHDRAEEAIAVWRKAALLDPDNAEIASYLRRTENEVKRLKELSYDHR